MWRASAMRAAAPLVLVGFLAASAPAAPEFHGLKVLPPERVTAVTLIDQRGRPFAVHDQRGRAVLLMFGYTYCADLCPATLGLLKRAHAELANHASHVRFVFVTTDPARDTPERLKAYLTLFHRDVIGLTGSPASLTRAYRAFNIFPERYAQTADGSGYRVSHAPAVYLVDPGGFWRFSYAWGMPARDVAGDVRLVLQGY